MARMRTLVVSTLAAAALLATAACSKKEEPAGPRPAAPGAQAPAAQPPAAPAPQQPAAPAAEEAKVEVTPEARAEAEELFTGLCATCHGTTGMGDGPAAAGFPIKPRSYADPEWQKSVTDKQIADVIVNGGPAIGKSPLMPANPQLASKPAVVQALVERIRTFNPEK